MIDHVHFTMEDALECMNTGWCAKKASSKKSIAAENIKYYLFVRWSPECKEAFEITKEGANFIERECNDLKSIMGPADFVWVPTPTGHTIKVKLNKALAYKVFTKEYNPLNDDSHYENELN